MLAHDYRIGTLTHFCSCCSWAQLTLASLELSDLWICSLFWNLWQSLCDAGKGPWKSSGSSWKWAYSQQHGHWSFLNCVLWLVAVLLLVCLLPCQSPHYFWKASKSTSRRESVVGFPSLSAGEQDLSNKLSWCTVVLWEPKKVNLAGQCKIEQDSVPVFLFQHVTCAMKRSIGVTYQLNEHILKKCALK